MKAKEIYKFADKHIRTMLIHDLRGCIGKYNKKFFELYSKPIDVVLGQTLDKHMLEELVIIAKKRIDQAQYYKDYQKKEGYYYMYDEDRVQRAYVDIINYIINASVG